MTDERLSRKTANLLPSQPQDFTGETDDIMFSSQGDKSGPPERRLSSATRGARPSQQMRPVTLVVGQHRSQNFCFPNDETSYEESIGCDERTIMLA
jgi:hypothetical protein